MDINQTQLIFALATSTLGGGLLLGLYLRRNVKRELSKESREEHEAKLRFPEDVGAR
jgi:hypothetical protein